jgi:TonB family protein
VSKMRVGSADASNHNPNSAQPIASHRSGADALLIRKLAAQHLLTHHRRHLNVRVESRPVMLAIRVQPSMETRTGTRQGDREVRLKKHGISLVTVALTLIPGCALQPPRVQSNDAAPRADGQRVTATDESTIVPPVAPPDIFYCPYPPEVEKARQQRTTTSLSTTIDVTGKPIQTSVLTQSGYPQLDAAAMECFSQKRFQPAIRAGKAVEWRGVFNFKWEPLPQLPNSCKPLDKPYKEPVDTKGAVVFGDKEITKLPSLASAVVCICFSDSGELAKPIIMQSSGDARFDDEAVGLAKKSRFMGHPGCSNFGIVFKVKDQPPHE